MENYTGNVTLKRGERKERLQLNERAQPLLCITADVQLGEWRDLMRAGLSSLLGPD